MKPAAVVTLFLAILAGCKPVGDPPPATGALYGRVLLYDEDSLQVTDFSGVSVTIDSGSTITTSSKDGSWAIYDLTAGTHTVTFDKPGFGGYVKTGYPFDVGAPVFFDTTRLGNIARFTVTLQPPAIAADSSITLSGSISSPPRSGTERWVFIYADTVAAVSFAHSLQYWQNAVQGGTSFTLALHLRSRYPGGTHLYFAAYAVGNGWSRGYGAAYHDTTLNADVYPTMNPAPSAVVSVTIP